jgi:hypothetical protein
VAGFLAGASPVKRETKARRLELKRDAGGEDEPQEDG